MRWMGSALAACAAFLALPASAQPSDTNAVCQVAQPAVPPVNWHGTAAYRAVAVVKDGRMKQIEITSLSSGVERRAQRALVNAIYQALRVASCQPGDRVFEQTFTFDIPPAPAGAASSTI